MFASRPVLLGVAVTTIAMALAGCGGDDEDETTTMTMTMTTTTTTSPTGAAGPVECPPREDGDAFLDRAIPL